MISLNLLSASLFLLAIFLLVMVSSRYCGPLILAFFTWLGGVLADPNDKQGSTKRVCLLLVIFILLLLLVVITIATEQLPTVPDSLLYLILALVSTFTGGMVLDKAIAAYKTVNGASNATADQ